MSAPLTLGVSACLLGERVRWNGEHERRSFLADVLTPHVEWVRVCPEVEAGLGVPREAIAFVRSGGGLALFGAQSRRDITADMQETVNTRVEALALGNLDGYVLVRNSPSCGLSGARVYATLDDLAADGPFERAARGIFAEALVRRLPWLPVVEEVDLETRAGQEHFVERCFAARRVRELGKAPAPSDLAAFHDRHELQILARSAEARRTLGRLAEGRGDVSADDAAAAYVTGFAAAMAQPPPPVRIVGVLRRVERRLAMRVAATERGEIAAAIAAFETHGGELDELRDRLLEVAARTDDEVLVSQTFLAVDPQEKAIRAAIRAV